MWEQFNIYNYNRFSIILPMEEIMTYVVIYGYSTYSSGKYGSANAEDFSDNGQRIGTALGTWNIAAYGTPVNGLLTRAATGYQGYNPIHLSDSFYNSYKTEIDQWMINNPTHASKITSTAIQATSATKAAEAAAAAALALEYQRTEAIRIAAEEARQAELKAAMQLPTVTNTTATGGTEERITLKLKEKRLVWNREVMYADYKLMEDKALIIAGNESYWMGYLQSEYFTQDFYVMVTAYDMISVSLYIKYGNISYTPKTPEAAGLITITTPPPTPRCNPEGSFSIPYVSPPCCEGTTVDMFGLCSKPKVLLPLTPPVTPPITECLKEGEVNYPFDGRDCCPGTHQDGLISGICVAEKALTECAPVGYWNFPGTGPACCGEAEGATKRDALGTCVKSETLITDKWGLVNGICVKGPGGIYATEAECKLGEKDNLIVIPEKTYTCVDGKVVEQADGKTYAEAEKDCKIDYTMYILLGIAVVVLFIMSRRK